MEKPIACSLDGTEMQTQLAEWRAVLASVASVERESERSLRMRFRPDTEHVGAIAALAQREVACCNFFRFSLEIDAEGATLVASVPPEGEPVLDAFATLAP